MYRYGAIPAQILDQPLTDADYHAQFIKNHEIAITGAVLAVIKMANDNILISRRLKTPFVGEGLLGGRVSEDLVSGLYGRVREEANIQLEDAIPTGIEYKRFLASDGSETLFWLVHFLATLPANEVPELTRISIEQGLRLVQVSQPEIANGRRQMVLRDAEIAQTALRAA